MPHCHEPLPFADQHVIILLLWENNLLHGNWRAWFKLTIIWRNRKVTLINSNRLSREKDICLFLSNFCSFSSNSVESLDVWKFAARRTLVFSCKPNQICKRFSMNQKESRKRRLLVSTLMLCLCEFGWLWPNRSMSRSVQRGQRTKSKRFKILPSPDKNRGVLVAMWEMNHFDLLESIKLNATVLLERFLCWDCLQFSNSDGPLSQNGQINDVSGRCLESFRVFKTPGIWCGRYNYCCRPVEEIKTAEIVCWDVLWISLERHELLLCFLWWRSAGFQWKKFRKRHPNPHTNENTCQYGHAPRRPVVLSWTARF